MLRSWDILVDIFVDALMVSMAANNLLIHHQRDGARINCSATALIISIV